MQTWLLGLEADLDIELNAANLTCAAIYQQQRQPQYTN